MTRGNDTKTGKLWLGGIPRTDEVERLRGALTERLQKIEAGEITERLIPYAEIESIVNVSRAKDPHVFWHVVNRFREEIRAEHKIVLSTRYSRDVGLTVLTDGEKGLEAGVFRSRSVVSASRRALKVARAVALDRISEIERRHLDQNVKAAADTIQRERLQSRTQAVELRPVQALPQLSAPKRVSP